MRLEDHRRDRLLREMGIQTYVPRRALPAARASAHATMPIRSAAAETSTTREEAVLQLLPPSLQSPASVATTEVPQAAPTQWPVADPAAAPTLSSAAARFAFAYIPVNDHPDGIHVGIVRRGCHACGFRERAPHAGRLLVTPPQTAPGSVFAGAGGKVSGFFISCAGVVADVAAAEEGTGSGASGWWRRAGLTC